MNGKESTGQGFRFDGLLNSVLDYNNLTFQLLMSVSCIFIVRKPVSDMVF